MVPPGHTAARPVHVMRVALREPDERTESRGSMHGPRSAIAEAQCSHRLGATSILGAKLHLSEPPPARQTLPASSVERWLRHVRRRGYTISNGPAALRHARHQLVARAPMLLQRDAEEADGLPSCAHDLPNFGRWTAEWCNLGRGVFVCPVGLPSDSQHSYQTY